jgi:hypothetical protein
MVLSSRCGVGCIYLRTHSRASFRFSVETEGLGLFEQLVEVIFEGLSLLLVPAWLREQPLNYVYAESFVHVANGDPLLAICPLTPFRVLTSYDHCVDCAKLVRSETLPTDYAIIDPPALTTQFK